MLKYHGRLDLITIFLIGEIEKLYQMQKLNKF